MKADQLASGSPFFKACIYGAAGAGKTCFAAQLPGRIEYWDFDNKIESAVAFLKKSGKADQLKNIDVYQFGKLPMMQKIPAWLERTTIIDRAIQLKQPLHFDTLVIDSLSALSHNLMEDYIYRSRKGLKRPEEGINGMQDYQFYEKDITRFLVNTLSLDINLVVLGHIDIDKDELTGSIERKILCKGKALAPALPMWFPEVYAAITKSDGTRHFLTQPSQGYVARTQRGHAKEIPMTVEAALKN
jgi:hypothetical protein